MYGISSPKRAAHFFGQSAQESYYFMITREASVSISNAIKNNHFSVQEEKSGYLRVNSHNRDQIKYLLRYEYMSDLGNTDEGDGVKFRGRGMKQLTGRYNYAQYLVYRGWLQKDTFKADWFNRKGESGPIINNPETAADDPFNAVDTAGFYFVARKVASAADKGVNEAASIAVSSIVNPREKPPAITRWVQTLVSYGVLGNE